MMESQTLRVGAVAGVERIKNPISLARKVMESPHVLLVGKGAQEFAQEQSIPLCKFEDLLTERQYKRWQDNKVQAATTEQEPRYLRRQISSTTAREDKHGTVGADRKSTRLNSSHQIISYAVFCLKKKKKAPHL